ncbi:MAG: YicC/YloC family endoribonuclease [Clostridia bacterium]
MLQSMTGYGMHTEQIGNRDFTFEVKGVNNRYLDVRVHLPRDYYKLESEIKDLISTFVNRGKVDLYINFKTLPDTDIEVEINEKLMNEYYHKISSALKGIKQEQKVNIDFILSQPNIVTTKEPEIEIDDQRDEILEAISKACKEFVSMRKMEANNLVKSINEQLNQIQTQLALVSERSNSVVIEYKEKLEEKIGDLLPEDVEVDQDKLANEVAYYADKAGIDEEIVRISSHVNQFHHNLKSERKVGRKLDFLVQELNREINTIGSKSSDVPITNAVVELKSIIEKIREQVQNLE